MARRNQPKSDPSKIAEIASFVGKETQRDVEPKRGRSKRGITHEDTSQICFRIEKSRHKAIRVYCVENEIEIGELMDKIVRDQLNI